MKPSEFCYWLQGFYEISGESKMTKEQGDMVKRHLALVFKHELDSPDPSGELQAIHDGEQSVLPEGPILYRC